MKAIIIDDEPHCIGALEIILQDSPHDVEIITTCQSGPEALEALAEHSPDVIFLDIAMPRMNGFEMLARVDQPDFEIVFTTAYDSYALQALKVSAVDYLLKPVDYDELQSALAKVEERLRTKQGQSLVPPLNSSAIHWQMVLENFQRDSVHFPNIALPTINGYEMVRIREILYVEADGNYSRVFFESDNSIFISKTLKEMQRMLEPYAFVRVHHSHVVNKSHIKRYVRGEGGQVIMENGQSINVSRRRKPELMKALKGLA